MPCRHIAELTGGGLTERGWEARGRGKVRMPLPWLNVINGGAHAGKVDSITHLPNAPNEWR